MLNPLIMRRFSLDGDVETARQLVAKVMSVACVATESGSSRLSLVQLSLGPFAWRSEPGPRTAQLGPGEGFHLLLVQLSFTHTAVFHSYSCHCTELGPGAVQLGPGAGFHLSLIQLSFTHTAVTVQSQALELFSWGQAQAFIFYWYSCLSLIQLSLYRARPWSRSSGARHGLLHLHLHSELDLYEGFDVITTPKAS